MPVVASPPGSAPMDDTQDRNARPTGDAPLTIAVESVGELVSVRRAMRQWLSHALDDNETDEVLLAGGEALANAIEHGEPPVIVSLEWVRDRRLQISVRDSGAWHVSGETTSRGLGIPIMTALMDSFTIDTIDGTSIQLSRQFTV